MAIFSYIGSFSTGFSLTTGEPDFLPADYSIKLGFSAVCSVGFTLLIMFIYWGIADTKVDDDND